MTVLNSQQNKLWPVNGKQYWAKRVAGWKAGWQNSGYIYCVLQYTTIVIILAEKRNTL